MLIFVKYIEVPPLHTSSATVLPWPKQRLALETRMAKYYRMGEWATAALAHDLVLNPARPVWLAK